MMYSSQLLIVNNKEAAVKYRRKLRIEDSLVVNIAQNEDEALEQVTLFEPELILLANEFNNFDGYELCKKVREIPCLTRPVIVMTSDKEENSTHRIKGLMQGADDFFFSSIDDEEFSVRILAHLRRHIEELSDQTTRLPGATIINTNIKRKINHNKPWALMLMTLTHLKPYNDTYGFLAGTQLIKAFLAIVKANSTKDDFIGHLGNDDFVLLTTPAIAEKIAESVCKTFDNIVPKFYAPFEAERGFTIVADEGKASRKVPLVSVYMGIVSSENRYFDDYKTVLSVANGMKDLAKHQIGSGWLLDRPQITGEEKYDREKQQSYVLVVESDAALAYLLTTTLEMQGYLVDAASNKEQAISLINKKQPDLVLIDAILPGDDGWGICSHIRKMDLLSQTKIIMATVLHDKERAFLAGADLYIPKPYEIMALHKWINKLLMDSYF